MKRRSWIPLVFGSVIVISLAMALIFWPKPKDDPVIPDDEVVDEEPKEDGDEEEIEIYATRFDVNLPGTINLLKGTIASFASGYLVVTPQEMQSKINIEIVPRYNSSAFGLEFSNSILTAKEVGSYNLIFSVPKSKTANFSKTILVTVYEDVNNAHVKQIADNMIKGESKNIDEFFEFNTTLNYSLAVDNKLGFSNNLITALQVGESDLTISLIDVDIIYKYNFKIQINAQPQYYFVLPKVNNNTVKAEFDLSKVLFIEYEVKDRESENILQTIETEIDDETIAVVDYVAAPTIKIKLLNKGTTKLTLIYSLDNSIKIEINLIIN